MGRYYTSEKRTGSYEKKEVLENKNKSSPKISTMVV